MTSHVIMSGPEVRAIDEGRKTQFRRAMKKQPPEDTQRAECVDGVWRFYGGVTPRAASRRYLDSDTQGPFKPGAIIHVKETWCRGDDAQLWYRADADDRGLIPYKDSGTVGGGVGHVRVDKWDLASTMPASFARLWLKITKVWVERLRDINAEDALAEGVEYNAEWGRGGVLKQSMLDAPRSFAYFWDSLPRNKKHPWASNHWIFAHEFEQADKP